MIERQTFLSKSEIDTFNLGLSLSKNLGRGTVIGLEGSLGAGKSVFIRGVLSGLGVKEAVPSPTFTLVNEYSALYKIYHFDLYRLNDPYELYEIGFEDYIYSDGISLIEWYNKAGDILPENIVKIKIRLINDNEREILIE